MPTGRRNLQLIRHRSDDPVNPKPQLVYTTKRLHRLERQSNLAALGWKRHSLPMSASVPIFSTSLSALGRLKFYNATTVNLTIGNYAKREQGPLTVPLR